jgi:WD40-like Beta Propeller Repeat
VDAVDGGATPLQPADARHPSWSPDGTRIAFDIWDGNNSQVAVMNADGSNVQLLTSGHDDDWPVWSSDGDRIAFASADADQPDYEEVDVINADGSGRHRVSDNVHASAQPAWAPGRAAIAWGDWEDVGLFRGGGIFVANADASGRVWIAGQDEAGIEIRNAATGGLQRSFVPPGTAIAVALSATHLAVLVYNQQQSRLELQRFRVDGTPLGPPAPSNATCCLGMAGQWIVYATRRLIFAMDAETGKAKVVARPAAGFGSVSILNRRVIWAEPMGYQKTRIKAVMLSPGGGK